MCVCEWSGTKENGTEMHSDGSWQREHLNPSPISRVNRQPHQACARPNTAGVRRRHPVNRFIAKCQSPFREQHFVVKQAARSFQTRIHRGSPKVHLLVVTFRHGIASTCGAPHLLQFSVLSRVVRSATTFTSNPSITPNSPAHAVSVTPSAWATLRSPITPRQWGRKSAL